MFRDFHQQRTVYLVQVFHHRKIFWRFGLSFQQVFNKSCFIILILKRPVTDFLVTNSRTWYCSQGFTTSRTRSMCWPYLHVFRQFSKALYRFIHLFGSFRSEERRVGKESRSRSMM